MFTSLYQINSKDHFGARIVLHGFLLNLDYWPSDSQDGTGTCNGLIRQVDVTVSTDPWGEPGQPPLPGCCPRQAIMDSRIGVLMRVSTQSIFKCSNKFEKHCTK